MGTDAEMLWRAFKRTARGGLQFGLSPPRNPGDFWYWASGWALNIYAVVWFTEIIHGIWRRL